MGAHSILECFNSRYGRSQHLGSQSWALTIYISDLTLGMAVTTFGISEMGAHNIHECLDSRIGRSQNLGSQSWGLTIHIIVLSLGMGAHNVGVPRNGRSQYTLVF